DELLETGSSGQFVFREDDPEAVACLNGIVQFCWNSNFSFDTATRLLRRFARDPLPAFGTFGCSACEVCFSPSSDHGDNGSHAQLDHFFDRPLHTIELENGKQ